MHSEKIKAALAPCGLSCEKCFAHVDGEIRRLSLELREKLGSFENYAGRYVTIMGNPVFERYPAFKEMLDFFAAENCRGCRNEPCPLFEGCGVRVCHRTMGVDFCWECADFPCDRTGFDESLHLAWRRINEIIRSKGLEAYHELTRNRPRYV